jgi:hypothetical protein
MFIVPSTAVQFCAIPPGHLADRAEIPNSQLVYNHNYYLFEARFDLSQRQQVADRWKHLTDHCPGVYLVVAEAEAYSLWQLMGPASLPVPVPSNPDWEPLLVRLVQSFGLIIADLGGIDRLRAFSQELLASDLPIDSPQQLQKYLSVPQPPTLTATLWQEGAGIVQQFRALASDYVGQSCALQVCTTLGEQLSTDAALPTRTFNYF